MLETEGYGRAASRCLQAGGNNEDAETDGDLEAISVSPCHHGSWTRDYM